MALVGSLDSQLAQKRTELATMSQTYQPDAPQLTGLRREIAALEAERARAVQRAMSTPGEQASGHQIEAQAVLMDYEFAQQGYMTASSGCGKRSSPSPSTIANMWSPMCRRASRSNPTGGADWAMFSPC